MGQKKKKKKKDKTKTKSKQLQLHDWKCYVFHGKRPQHHSFVNGTMLTMLTSSSVVDVVISALTFHWFLPIRRQKCWDSKVSSTPQGHLKKTGTANWPVDSSSTPRHFPSIFHQHAQTLTFGVQHYSTSQQRQTDFEVDLPQQTICMSSMVIFE